MQRTWFQLLLLLQLSTLNVEDPTSSENSVSWKGVHVKVQTLKYMANGTNVTFTIYPVDHNISNIFVNGDAISYPNDVRYPQYCSVESGERCSGNTVNQTTYISHFEDNLPTPKVDCLVNFEDNGKTDKTFEKSASINRQEVFPEGVEYITFQYKKNATKATNVTWTILPQKNPETDWKFDPGSSISGFSAGFALTLCVLFLPYSPEDSQRESVEEEEIELNDMAI